MLLFVGELIKEEIELYIKSPDEDQIEHFGDMYEKVFEYLVAGDTLQCRKTIDEYDLGVTRCF